MDAANLENEEGRDWNLNRRRDVPGLNPAIRCGHHPRAARGLRSHWYPPGMGLGCRHCPRKGL